MGPHVIKHLAVNLGPRACKVLGLRQYLRMLACCVVELPAIAKRGNLQPLDYKMGRGKPVRVRFLQRKWIIDCEAIDAIIHDGAYTFGLVRELYIRNCYGRYGIGEVLSRAQYVLDLGANRGVFSIMAATMAEKVIAVEVKEAFVAAIQTNLDTNHLNNVAIETIFVGSGGADAQSAQVCKTIPQLMSQYQIPRFDLVKIDIEGSEFGLFADADWLALCGAICMEVHPAFGHVDQIVQTLRRYGFEIHQTDRFFHSVALPQQTEFIWAIKQTEPTGLTTRPARQVVRHAKYATGPLKNLWCRLPACVFRCGRKDACTTTGVFQSLLKLSRIVFFLSASISVHPRLLFSWF